MSQRKISHLLDRTLLGMKVVYSAFTVGLAGLLYTHCREMSLALMIGPALVFSVYAGIRNKAIRTMGFNQVRPYPKDWSDAFHEREAELFKFFTIAWTLLLAFWYVRKLITSRPP